MTTRSLTTDFLRELAALAIVPLAGIAIVAGIILVGGSNPAEALGALLRGSLSGSYSRSETLVSMAPLLLSGLGVAIAFRGGVWNIGGEGQIYLGALAMTLVSPWLAGLPAWFAIPMGLAAGFASGGFWAWIAAVLRTRRQVQEVISTIMLNFIAIQLASWAVHGPLKESSGQFPYSNQIPGSLMLPVMVEGTRLHLGVVLALLAALVTWFYLFRTVGGFHIRVTGSAPEAGRHSGIPLERAVWKAMFYSGGLCGVAGAVQLMGISHILYEQFSPGWGYTAIAVALLGALHPAGVVAAALVLGALQAGSGSMQRDANVSAVLVYAVQGIIILSVGLIASRKLRRKQALLAHGAEEVS